MSLFTGSGTALVTPFDRTGKIDFVKFGKLIDFQVENQADALIICGTTGEGSTISFDEKMECFEFAAERVNGKIPILAGTGSNSTEYTQKLIREAEKTGIDGHLIVTPYYNKTSQNGLIKHYTAAADTAERPVIVYNVPSRTGVNILPKTYCELSKHENIIGAKEANGNLTAMMNTMILCGENLDIYVGNDDQTASAVAMGAKGVISVLANIMPKEMHEIATLGIDGKTRESHEMQMKYLKLISLLFSDVNPIPIKCAMEHLGMIEGHLRLPLVEMKEDKKQELIEEMERLGIKNRYSNYG